MSLQKTSSFCKCSEALKQNVCFRPNLFIQLCIMQFRMQSPEWLNITFESTICQVRMIILLSTSTSLSSIVSGTTKLETREPLIWLIL